MKTQIKVIVIQAFKWWDKTNGNTYNRIGISIVDSNNKRTSHITPFQYGYGDGDQYAAEHLGKSGVIKLKRHDNGMTESLWRYCERKKIVLIRSKEVHMLKAELINL